MSYTFCLLKKKNFIFEKQFTVYIDDPYKTVTSLADTEMFRAVELLSRDFDDNKYYFQIYVICYKFYPLQ